jgi:peptidoglycan/xylan/chitin deacetylase (PgdA/CDA1 family)
MPEVRVDRLATLYLFHPLQRLLRRIPAGIPILMYHSISKNIEVYKRAYYHTCTAPQVFREHLGLLARNGYKTISLGEAVRKLQANTQTTEKLVALTFDDGFEDFYTEAFPILSALGYTATVFLPTAYIGNTPRKFNGTTCLTWSQVRELQQAGIGFGSHTVTHPQLRAVGPDQLRDELQHSKWRIEEAVGKRVESFSYPYAFPETDRFFVQQLHGVLAGTGYNNGVSTIIGMARRTDNPLFLKRLSANSDDSLPLFRAKLEGAYDWLHGFQYASKLRKLGSSRQTQ